MVPAFLGYMGEDVSFTAGLLILGSLMLTAPLLTRFLHFRQDGENGC